jgi:formylglycine-generating enzyme required for sulfatase activity
MKMPVMCARTVCLVLCFGFGSWVHAVDPVVSNVQAHQRTGTKLIDITYTLVDPDSTALTVTIAISNDGGATWGVPCASLTGNGIGTAVTPGSGKAIVWYMGADWADQWSEQMRVQVTADDTGTSPAPDAFAFIPGGTSSGTNPLAADESYDPVAYPQSYSLTVSPFYMGTCEVTKAKWDEVRAWASSRGYTDLPAGSERDGVDYSKGPDHPVHLVSWYDCVKWCNARSEKEERTPCYTVSGSVYRTGEGADVSCNTSASGYRLPTDTEWEYAARGGLISRRFSWGDTIAHSQANYYSSSSYSYDVSPTREYHPDYDTGDYAYTSPVGSFPANAYGLYDMAGNLWEWCWDWYPGYVGSYRVGRGGGWYRIAGFCRAGYRIWYYPDHHYGDGGFRLCSAAPVQ